MTADIDDPTVAYTGDQPVPESLPSTEGDHSATDDSVGPKNIPGYDRVVALADFLVSLKDSLGALRWLNTVFQCTGVSKHYLKTTYF